MSTLILSLMLQYVVSTKAGMVNHIQGNVSVNSTETVPAGVPIKTGAGGYAEILLNPGSFLRLGENSEAVLDGVELTNIMVRTISGGSIIEVTELDDDYPITVTTGSLTVQIVQSGLYRFEDGTASILSGKLKVRGSSLTYKKGWALFSPVGGYRAKKLEKSPNPTALDAWSKSRSGLIAQANVDSFPTFQNERPGWSGSAWMWVPGFGAWTFIPRSGVNSPYGYRYRSYTQELPRDGNFNDASSPTDSAPRTATQTPAGSTAERPSSPVGRPSSEEYLNRKTAGDAPTVP